MKANFSGMSKAHSQGAIKDRAGRFQLADGGTLFLDEIGEVPSGFAEQITARVAGRDLRDESGMKKHSKPMCASLLPPTRNLKEEVQAKRFREDLYYRLNVFPIGSASST